MARSARTSLGATLLDYGRLALQTLRILRQTRPEVLWIQLPPVPLLWAALWHRRFVDPQMRVVADCHNAMFGRRWRSIPLGQSLLWRCDLTVVHNDRVLSEVQKLPRVSPKLLVLEDIPAARSPNDDGGPLPAALSPQRRPWILFPGSFSADEPIGPLLEAARQCPQWTFVLTGRLDRARRYGHTLGAIPENVLLTGYLEVPSFNRLLTDCDLVLALTTEDGIQLSVCNEALGFRKPMVVSDTPLLRELFGQAAIMLAEHDVPAIRRAIETGLERAAELVLAADRLALERREEWKRVFAATPAWLHGREPTDDVAGGSVAL